MTTKKPIYHKCNLLVCILLMTLYGNTAIAQTQVFANQVTLENNVDNAVNATINNENFATLNSYGGIAVGVGAYSGELELEFPNTIPANTTSYVRINFDEDYLNALLGGSLGNLLADVIGTVLFGNHYINIEARNNTTTVLSSTTLVPPSNESFRIVTDALGNYYLAITPNQDYNRIYIEDVTSNLLLGVFNSMDVYYAFYYEDNECAIDPLFTDYDGSGITLDLLTIGGAGVTNPEFAIDNNPDNFSEISLGVLGVLATMEQNVYFATTYDPGDDFSVTLKTDPTLVSLGLLNNVQVRAYEGTNLVFTENINTVLTLDLLTLLQNGEQATIPFEPNVAFDRVTVSLTSLLNVNIAQSIDFYGVQVMKPEAPTTTNESQTFCAVTNPTVSDIQVNESNILWYDVPSGGTPLDPSSGLVDGASYYGAQVVDGCESPLRLEVNVSINDTPTPTTDNSQQTFCVVDQPLVSDLQVDGPNIVWYNASTGGTPYAPTDPLLDGQSYYATATDTTGCESSIRLEVEVSLDDTSTPTTANSQQDFCQVDGPTVADLQATGPNIVWYDLPTGGTPYDPTDPLVDGNSYYATATDASGCESSERLQVDVSVGDTDVPTTANSQQDFCQVDGPTVADLQATGPNIVWYDMPTGGTPYDPTDPLVDGNSYYATATDASGCESSMRLQVDVSVFEKVTPTITSLSNSEVCLQTIVTYTTDEGFSNYLWNVSGGIAVDGGGASDSFISVEWTEIEETFVSVSYDAGTVCGISETTTFTEEVMVCADIVMNKTVDNIEPMVGDQITFTVEVTNNGPNDFTDIEISEIIQSGFDYISHTVNLGDYDPVSGVWMIDLLPANETATLQIIVEVLGTGSYMNMATIVSVTPNDSDDSNNEMEVGVLPACLFVYNEFSPNSDGINDFFTISCIESFPNNEIKIFNRYGSLVYKQQGYKNEWNGHANVSTSQNNGETLPTGTYFYVLEIESDILTDRVTGWVYLMK